MTTTGERATDDLAEILAWLRRWDPVLTELEAALPMIRTFVDNPVRNYVRSMRRNRDGTD